jgi:hypothetical protein
LAVRRIALVLAIITAGVVPAPGQEYSAATPVAADARTPGGPTLSLEEQEHFLLNSRLDRIRGVSEGVTGTQRATLVDGEFRHDASVQTIDESKQKFEGTRRVEFNFRDYWGYNVAAYRLGVLLGLDNIPPSVARRHRTGEAAFTWWVDDVLMDERARQKKKQKPPDGTYWNYQLHVMRVFDELIANADRNAGNMLIDAGWKLWLIDHSRAFRTGAELSKPQGVKRCERALLAKMRALTRASMVEQLDKYLTPYEIDAILKRRDRLVAHIDALGPSALYDLRRPDVSVHRTAAQ